MTPMQSLKNQFDEFKLIVKNNGFEELNLNKSEPKTTTSSFCGETTVHENKGVKNDFIKLFKIKFNKENAYSIGFAFKYLELKEQEYKIAVSLKKGEDQYFASKDLSLQEFKEIFNNVLKNCKEKQDLNYEKIIQLVTNDFELLAQTSKKKIGKKRKI